MQAREFDSILEDRIDKIRKVMGLKAGEYAADFNRLINFEEGARLSGQTPAQVCLGYALKHWVSIWKIVNEMADGNATQVPLLDEKIGDAVNYLILLEALVIQSQKG